MKNIKKATLRYFRDYGLTVSELHNDSRYLVRYDSENGPKWALMSRKGLQGTITTLVRKNGLEKLLGSIAGDRMLTNIFSHETRNELKRANNVLRGVFDIKDSQVPHKTKFIFDAHAEDVESVML